MRDQTSDNGLDSSAISRRSRLGRWPGRWGGGNRVVALDLDGRTLHIARATRRGRQTRVTHLASRPLPPADQLDPTDAKALGQWIRTVLRELKLKAPVVMGVPRGQVLLRPITLPVITTAQELPAMARFQASKDLPLTNEEAIIDVTVQAHFDSAPPTETPEGSRIAGREQMANGAARTGLDVLAAAVRRQAVAFHQQVAAAAGVRLAALGLRSFAHARCIKACADIEPNACVGVIHIGTDELLIDVLRGVDLVFTRALRMPATASKPHEQADQLATEVIRNLRSYEAAQPTHHIDRILLTGTTGLEATLSPVLAERLSRPCEPLNVAKALQLADEHRGEAPAAIAAIGLALGALDPAGLPFDFLHPREAPPQRDHRRLQVGLAAACVIGSLVIGYTIRHNMLETRRATLGEITTEIRQVENNLRFYRQSLREHETLEQWQQRRQPWIDHLAYLSAILPVSDEIYITQLTTAPSGAMRLTVQARDTQILLELDERLHDAGYDLRPMAVTPVNDRHGYPFRATLEMAPPSPHLDIDLAAHQPEPRPSDDASLD